ncbi:uncharacterized protein LOC132943385 [Metopolophium dirhodum]|uniref:uncharacterized protein LOC132935274 n=1 Tax=Metopolophium dirhodum TaxID=44670 RepID=UPI00299013BB|nr:uncharacterized protein LOC132935274 [Metopolophium dirhodum]XP_060857994.1 uncharacterized protein LOC132935456 [Metopolophium dirhodum]XP_060868342.1 uncharacterized protein LOC132943385 [Metopolophium dirhodum]
MSNNSSPSTPVYEGDEFNRRLAGIPMEGSQNTDHQSPVVIEGNFFMYGEMTQSGDSGYSTNPSTQVENRDWHRAYSPFSPSASPPQLSQMENRVRSLSPDQPVFMEEVSPDMFPPTTPRAYALRVRNDLFPEVVSQPMVPPEFNLLIVGEIMNTSRHSGGQSPEMDWSDDGNDEEFIRHMEAYEEDEELNRYMDLYEGGK